MIFSEIYKKVGEENARLNERKIDYAITRRAYAQTNFSQIASFLCIIAIYFSFYLFVTVVPTALNIWLIASVLVIVFRTILTFFYFRKKNRYDNYMRWKVAFIIGAWLGGLCWGSLGVFFFSDLNTPQQMLVILVLAGVTAGAMTVLSTILEAGIGFVTLAIFPFIIAIFPMTNIIYPIFGFTLTVYLIYLLTLTYSTHLVIRNTIQLQFEKDALLNELENLATHDPLTKVENLRLFYLNLPKAINQAEHSGALLGIFFIDIDRFKEYNDDYGHHVGDIVLIEVVRRIKKNLRLSDSIARVGGDEFVCLIVNILNIQDLDKIADKICHEISVPFKAADIELSVTVSIGISVCPLDTNNADSLLQIADKAMYFVKENGGNNFAYSPRVARLKSS